MVIISFKRCAIKNREWDSHIFAPRQCEDEDKERIKSKKMRLTYVPSSIV